jgi:hypothetical protein
MSSNDLNRLKYDEDYVIVEQKPLEENIKIVEVFKPRRKHNRVVIQDDYLKYWRVVRNWVNSKYPEISIPDIELLLFLYTEDPFNKEEFLEFTAILNWDKTRLRKLIKNGWIDIWRDKTNKYGKAKLYKISRKGSLLCTSIYKKLLLQEEIPEETRYSPMFKRDASYSEKVYRNAIKKMNEKIRQKKGSD